jgi:hypothetical protein
MFANPAASWYHSNQYAAASACEHCGGIIRHGRWCITCNALVQYAYGAVLDAAKLTLTDSLILHALGVSWQQNRCAGNCIGEGHAPSVQGKLTAQPPRPQLAS